MLDQTTVVTPALSLLDSTLVEVANGDCERLIWSMSPQEGKSQRVSRTFPLWMLLRNPELRIVIASYELGVARRWSRAIRNDIQEHPELGLKVREDTAAAHEWQLLGHKGGLYAVGVSGGLTGRPADCCSCKSEIITSRGTMTLGDLVASVGPNQSEAPLVLSWNHQDSRAEWREIEATRVVPEREVIEVSTEAGRVIRCTPDHRIYVSAVGYVAACELRAGDRVVVASEMPRLRDGIPTVRIASQGRSDVLHSTVPQWRSNSSGGYLRRLRHSLQSASLRGTQGDQERLGDKLLHEALPTGCSQSELPASVSDVRQRNWKPTPQILLNRVFGPLSQRSDQYALRTLWESVRHTLLRVGKKATAWLQDLLFSAMHGDCILTESDTAAYKSTVCSMRKRVSAGSRQSALSQTASLLFARMRQEWLGGELWDGRKKSVPCTRVSEDEIAGHRERPAALCCVPSENWADSVSGVRQANQYRATGSASHQPRPNLQQTRKSNHPVQDVPLEAPRIDHDSISMVRRVCGPNEPVYDLQVEGNHNFFADGILVSNCMILDDPLKGRAEADSEAYRENTWDWWTETARTRLAPNAPVVLVMTRWAQDDLAGRLIEQDPNWRVVNIPALCDEVPDPLGRELGEYLVSARGRTPEQWQQIQREVGERAWNALYQGRPSPAEGGMFKRSWWQYDEIPVCYRKSDGTMHAQGMDVVIQSWDMTFKNTDGTDFVVGQVWGRAGATAHLLDQVRSRLDFPETCKAVQDLSAKWPQASLKLIEDKANGPAVISQLRKQIPGMVPVNPEGNKQARAAAVTPFVEAGNVCLPMPARAPWIGALIEEASAFPTGAHDDQVDALTQALARLMLMPSSTAFLEELVNQR